MTIPNNDQEVPDTGDTTMFNQTVDILDHTDNSNADHVEIFADMLAANVEAPLNTADGDNSAKNVVTDQSLAPRLRAVPTDSDEDDEDKEQTKGNTHIDPVARLHQGELYVDEPIVCRVCGDRLKVTASIFLACGHVFCRDCLNDCFRVGLSNKTNFPPRCCDLAGIDISVVESFLDEDHIMRYVFVGEEYSTRKPTFCAKKACSRFFDGNRVGKAVKFISCHECDTETCIECKQDRKGHTGEEEACPKLISKEDKELADGEKWKQCPGCKNLVEKDNGCNHMICECGTEFCYGCGEEKENNNGCGCRTVTDDDGWHTRMELEEMENENGGGG